MRVLNLYGPAYSGRLGNPDFVLPASMEEQEAWIGRVAGLPSLVEGVQRDFFADYRNILDGFDAANGKSDACW